jgi:hypothetical protein
MSRWLQDSFESNKFVISKFGNFVGKGYECGGLFRLSLSDVCNKVVNQVCNDSLSNVWHSQHVNFGCMTRLAKMNLIPEFTVVKGSKCQVCVQAKQPPKSHTTAEQGSQSRDSESDRFSSDRIES